jgi:hypothetical protein
MLQQQKAFDDAMKAEHERLQTSLGELFSGPITQQLQGWRLTFKNLKADLRAQIDAFKAWRTALTQLGQRGAPTEMLKQLEQLGPQATENLQILAQASSTDLAEYIAMWKESQVVIDENIDKQQVMADAIASLGTSLEDVSSSVEDMSSSFGDVGSSVDSMSSSIEALVPTMDDLIASLQEQSTGLIQWATDLQTLIARGLPRQLLQQIMELGPGAAQQVHLLATANERDLRTFVKAWQMATDTIAQINDDITKATDPAEILRSLEEQNTAFQNWQNDLAQVRIRLIANGITQKDAQDIIAGLQDLGPDAANMIKAISTMSDPQLQQFVTLWKTRQAEITTATKTEFKRQVNMWRSHGQDVAKALIQGVADQQGALEKWFTNLFKSLLVGGGVPSAPSGGGGGGGGGGPSRPPDIRDIGGGGSGGPTVNMTVNAVQSQSLDTAIAVAMFRLRNGPI